MRFVPSLVVGLVAASCALPSYEEFARGPTFGPDGGVVRDGGSRDGTTGALVDASVVDASSDSSLPDTKTDSSTGCSADFCTSFSSASALDEFTEETQIEAGGSVEINGGELRASIPAASGDPRPVAVVTRILSETTRRAILELDLRVDHGDFTNLTGNAAVLAVDMIATKYSNLQLYVGSDNSAVVPLRDNGTFESDGTSPNILRSKWVHIRLEVDFDPVNGKYVLSFDGAVAASRTGFAYGNPGGGKLRIQLGMLAVNPPVPSYDVRYDNLVVDLQ